MDPRVLAHDTHGQSAGIPVVPVSCTPARRSGIPDQINRGHLTVGQFNVEPRASQSSDDSGVRLACQKPNPTRTAITKAKTNAAIAAQKAMVPITEKA